MTKTLPLFTSSLNARAWAIRRSLASIHGVPVMQISWKECMRRASHALIYAVATRRYEAEQAAEAARLAPLAAAHRKMVEDGIAAGCGMGYFAARAVGAVA